MVTQTTSAYKRLLLSLIVVITLLTLNQQVAVAAMTYRFTGKVINRISNKPIEMATVRIPSLGLWAITDRNGKFSIPKLKAGKYSYEVRLLGYSTANGEVTIGDKTKEIVIKMDEQSLALKNITVTAKEQKSGSVSKIDMNAIQHLQPKSVEDLLQLVPGNVTKNPDLNSVGQAQIRELGSNSTNALGTAVVVNGAPLSNDGNMQSLSTAKHGTTIYSYDEQGTTGRGVDLRIISPDNIESMEVIRGIPSVEYGNLTSGAIVISTKSGYTPFEAKAKVDPNSKMFYLGKGFDLKKNRGTLNLSADYSQSYNDIRERYKGYDRFTFGISYANKYMEHTKPLTLKIDANMFTTLNSVKTDPQMKEKERIKNENTGARLNLEAKWRLDMAWITNMSFNAMANYTHQNDYRMQKVFLPTGMTPISESYVSGEFESRFQEASYYSEYTIDGKPLDLYAQLKADKLFQITDKAYNTIKIGAEFRLNKNYGDGMMFDTKYPPEVSGNQSIRPRAYKDVPSLKQLVGFIEDKWFQPVGNMSFTIQAGARFTNMFIEKGKALRGNIFSFEPRLNIELNILNRKNNNFFDNLSISGGYGIASKMPPMLYLYPDKAYFDVTSLAAMTERYQMVVMTTQVVDNTANKDLKATTNHKLEFSLNGSHKKQSFNITAFYEHCNNDFGFSSVYLTTPFRLYEVPTSVKKIEYKNHKVYCDGDEATYTDNLIFNTYSQPNNRIKTRKKGIEYSLNLGEVSTLKTSVVIDGAYIWIKRTSAATSMSVLGYSKGERYPYLPIYPAGSGSISDRFNTNIRFITHIPKLKLIFSTTAQIVWRETARNIYEDNNGNKLYYLEHNTQTREEGSYYVDPICYYDLDGNPYNWKTEYRDLTTRQSEMRISSSVKPDEYGKESYPTTILFNFRVTKELGKVMELSFLANNVFKFSKYFQRTTASGYTQLMLPLYFGAEMKIKF